MSDSPGSKKRKQLHEIEIDAPIDVVWKAITDGEEITRWLCQEAKVNPGLGGSYWISWGGPESGSAVIETWEPPSRVRLRMLPYGTGPYNEETARKSPMFQEYTLESRGNRTVLRLVHADIPDSHEWDGYYESTNSGWQVFLLGLRHYLEKHAGEPRDSLMIMRPVKGTLASAWARLTGPEGLGIGESISGPHSLAEANTAHTLQKYRGSSFLGQQLVGEVIIAVPPKSLLMTIESLDDSLLTAALEEMGGNTYFFMTLATFGLDSETREKIREAWSDRFAKLLPAD